jgi:FdrA protein
VLKRIEKVIQAIRKPVVTLFIGAETNKRGPATLEEAALQAVALSRESCTEVAADVSRRQLRRRKNAPTAVGGYAMPSLTAREKDLSKLAQRAVARRKHGQKYVRGLFSGGTFCAEAQIIFKDLLTDLYSNAPVHGVKPLRNSLVSQKNTVIDLGEDEFTVGRPHPMIDYSLRNRRILEEAADPGTAVILLDVVLGYGSNPDPAAELTPALRKAARKVVVVCSITGTDQDPQNRSQVEKALRKAAAIVMPSNAAACKLAGRIIQCLGRASRAGGSKR